MVSLLYALCVYIHNMRQYRDDRETTRESLSLLRSIVNVGVLLWVSQTL